VSELVAFIFRDQYRAPEVLNELRRRDWTWVGDLEEAVAVTINAQGKARVHLSIDPSTCEAAAWARLWGCLLDKTLFLPLAEVMVEVADGITLSSKPFSATRIERFTKSQETKWRHDTLDLSANFKRDVAALMVWGGSAIFMLLRDSQVPTALEQLRNYGDTIVHTTLSEEQDNKMLAMLAN
jgi:uncharacterized membrane protein